MNHVELGQQIMLLRFQKRITPSVLARRLNITVPELDEIESGQRQMELPMFVSLCQILNADPNDLLYASLSDDVKNLIRQQKIQDYPIDLSSPSVLAYLGLEPEPKKKTKKKK